MGKRYFTAVLLVVLLLIQLSACGSSQNNAQATDEPVYRIITATPKATAIPTVTPTPVVPVVDEDALSGIEISFWYASDPTSEDVIAGLVAQFNIENEAGIVVTSRNLFFPNDLEAAVAEAITSNQMPDVVLAEPYQYLPWAESGQLVDLDPYLESAAYGVGLEDFFPPILYHDSYFEGRWAFPGLFSAQVMLYNQSWARELGFESLPETTAAFERQACEAHQANGDQTGGWMIDTSPGGAAAWIISFEQYLDQLLDFKSRQVEAAYTFLADLYSQGCAWYPLETYPDKYFAARQGLFYSVNTSEIGYVDLAFDQVDSADVWVVIGYPNPEGEPRITLTGRSYVILKSEIKDQIAAWQLIRFLTSSKSQIALAEAGLYLPLDRVTAEDMRGNSSLPEVWQNGLPLLEQGVAEPRIRQWGVLKSVLQDAQAEVMDERFVPGTMSLFLDGLDTLANEILQ